MTTISLAVVLLLVGMVIQTVVAWGAPIRYGSAIAWTLWTIAAFLYFL